ncbi:MAG TPA: hypothetical protein VHO50_09760 [Bacteroidales bacterium]|nr:hypothetical protein [Bacteroidales bacterium]
MKKVLLFFVVVCFSMTQLLSQESTFNKGDKVLNLGLGLGSTLYSGGGYSGLIPPLSASLEVAVVDNILEKGVIGVGGYLGYASYEWSNYYKYTNIIIGPRGTFHYPLVDKLDTYAGLMIGYNIHSSKWVGTGTQLTSTSSSGLISSFFIGGRYWFSENFAGMAELGYGIAYLNLGVALKF